MIDSGKSVEQLAEYRNVGRSVSSGINGTMHVDNLRQTGIEIPGDQWNRSICRPLVRFCSLIAIFRASLTFLLQRG